MDNTGTGRADHSILKNLLTFIDAAINPGEMAMKSRKQSQSSRGASHFFIFVTTIKPFVIGFLGILILSGATARANQYIIEIQSDKKLDVRGVETLIWQNNTGYPATEIPLVYSCKIIKAAVHGDPVRIKNKRLLLPDAVEAGDGISVKIEFKVKARKAYGYRMLTGAWHPKAVTYRNGAYNPDQPQADNYEVTLGAPGSLVVAAAGRLLEQSLTADGRRYWRWRLHNVTSFGMAASPDFVETRRNIDEVDVRLFQLRGEGRFNPVMADYAVDVIAFYKKLFGFYPHPAAVLLPGDFEYGGGYAPASGIMVFHKNSGDYYLRWIVAHEIGHQYWGFDTVLDDGDFNHWPGLPLGIFSDQRYMALHGGGRFGTYQYREAAAKGLDTTIRQTSEQMKKLKFDWNNIICHSKAYGVVRMLEDLMGKDRFFHLLETLLDRYRYKVLSFDRFQSVAEEAAGQKLDWFFQDWVNTNGVASYSMENVKRREGGVSVQIRRTGTARFPLEIRLTMEDGSQITKRILHEPESQRMDFEVSGEPKLIEMDPGKICPLIKQGNEIWELQLQK